MLELRGVTKSYAGVSVLLPTDLALPDGRTTVLIGPSGCGKSTLVRLMAGLIRPDAGVVAFDGQEMTVKASRRLRQRIGFVVQDGGLFPHLTARGNVTLLARHLGWKAGHIRERLHELTELTHFPADRLDAYPVQMSGGQRQRVSLMRALMLDPPLLLLDEPLGALDPIIRSDLQADLKAVFQKLRKTVVLVTHDLGEAGFLGDLLVLMQQGQIVQQDSFRNLIDRPAEAFVTRFINAQRHPRELQGEPASCGFIRGKH
jgi:osmoprotectant transport system ATP-binding protein